MTGQNRDAAVLAPGQTCWRTERADRLSYLVDGADYFCNAKAAMLRARHRILLIGWDFDTGIPLERGGKSLPGPNQLGRFLYWMLWKRPELEVFLLKSNLRLLPAFDDIWDGITPVGLLNRLSSSRMHFAVDGAHPTGAVHHQKILVVDDVIAFCGGIDLTVDRWDTSEHADDNPLRVTGSRAYGPRHEVAVAVDRAAARALGEVARDRWQTATGQALDAIDAVHTCWPSGLQPTLRNVDVAIARTLPVLAGRPEVREIEALNLAAIAAARHTIYLENQYLASRSVAEALAVRLLEPDGPEIVIVLPRSSESRLEQESMDSARVLLLRELWSADKHHRFAAYWPVTEAGTPVYIHSKVIVVDDRVLRIGSSNFNNRSMGFDSECDVALEADPDDAAHGRVRAAISSLRTRLVCEHLGVSVDEFEAVVGAGHSFLGAVEVLRGDGRSLRRFTERTVADEVGPLAENDLMDPDHVPRSLGASVQRLIATLRINARSKR